MRRIEMACAVGLLLLTLPLQAQQTPAAGEATGDGRWRAWLGCWIPAQPARPDEDVRVCVVPTAGQAGVRMITFAGDQRILDEPVVADGSLQRLTPGPHESCDGGTRSRWSTDGERVFTNAEAHCPGSAPQLTSGLSTIMRDGRWLDIQVAQVAGENRVRVKQYVRAAGDLPPSLVDEGFRAPAPVPIQAVRVTAEDIVEAHRAVGAQAVEAWLAEADVVVTLDKRALAHLADAKVPERVIDLLVALAYPEHFEVRRRESSSGGFFDPFANPGADDAFDLYALYYSPFGFSWFNGGSPPDWWYGGDVIVPPDGGGGSTTQSPHGRVVNGSGYTQVQPREAVHSAPRSGSDTSSSSGGDSSSGSSSSGGGSGSGGSSASPAGYSGGGGGGGGTAVPR